MAATNTAELNFVIPLLSDVITLADMERAAQQDALAAASVDESVAESFLARDFNPGAGFYLKIIEAAGEREPKEWVRFARLGERIIGHGIGYMDEDLGNHLQTLHVVSSQNNGPVRRLLGADFLGQFNFDDVITAQYFEGDTATEALYRSLGFQAVHPPEPTHTEGVSIVHVVQSLGRRTV